MICEEQLISGDGAGNLLMRNENSVVKLPLRHKASITDLKIVSNTLVCIGSDSAISFNPISDFQAICFIKLEAIPVAFDALYIAAQQADIFLIIFNTE